MSATHALSGVFVVLVTYGDRWALLKEVLCRLINDELVTHCVVVDNGALHDIEASIAAAGWVERVTIVRLGKNMGSAAGYAAGIQCALLRAECSWIYMLDDDNRPLPDALQALANWKARCPSSDETCLLSLRNDRPEQSKALSTNEPIRHRRNSFMGFHVAATVGRNLGHAKTKPAPAQAEFVEVEFAPYGGLLFHRSWIDRIGLPDSSYFVYADDHEFTSRIVRAGGRILLINSSRVEDLETSWHLKPEARAAGVFSAATPSFRLYYSVRNRVHFERGNLVDSLSIYLLNAVAFLATRFARALIADRSVVGPAAKLAIAFRAAMDGWEGRLGRNARY